MSRNDCRSRGALVPVLVGSRLTPHVMAPAWLSFVREIAVVATNHAVKRGIFYGDIKGGIVLRGFRSKISNSQWYLLQKEGSLLNMGRG